MTPGLLWSTQRMPKATGFLMLHALKNDDMKKRLARIRYTLLTYFCATLLGYFEDWATKEGRM